MAKALKKIQNNRNWIQALDVEIEKTFLPNAQLSTNLIKENHRALPHLSSSLDLTARSYIEKKFIEIIEREQRRIGQDLHDGIGQLLTGIAFISKVLEQKLSSKLSAEADHAAEITKLVNEAINNTRSLVRALNPMRMEADGLLIALQDLAENIKKTFGIACRIIFNKPVYLQDNSIAMHLYRIIQEAVNNAIKHGKAKNIFVKFNFSDQRLVIKIKDDGVGFDSVLTVKRAGMGLDIMKCRATMIGASLAIYQDTDGGTIVKCVLEKDKK